MNLKLLHIAEIEIQSAIRYYDSQSEGLGLEFEEEVKAAVGRINLYPEAWQPLSRHVRRCRLERFPYGLVYQITGNTILIVAMMHLHRRPNSWRSRRDPGSR